MFEKFFKWMKKNENKDASAASKNSTPSSTVHILIDYENLLPQNLNKVPCDENTHIWLFIGSRQTKLNTGLMRAMQDFGDRSHQIYLDIAYKQPNALDFILSYYLGYISASYEQPKIAILSKDKGYEMVIDHARKQHNLSITRYDQENISPPVTEKNSISTAEQPTNPFGQAFREAIIYLTNSNNHFPPVRHELENLLAKEIVMSIFSRQEENFTEEHALNQARKLVNQLQVSRLIEIPNKESGSLIYHTDDESLYQRMKYFVSRKKPKNLNQLKEIILYNYSHREIQDKEVQSLVERLQQDKIFCLNNNDQNNNQIEEEILKSYDLNQLESKAIDFLKLGHGLPKKKSSFYNVIGTHTNTTDNDKILNMLVDRLIKKGLVRFDNNQVFYSKKSNY